MAAIGAVTLDGARIALGDESIDSLRKGLRGDLIRSHDDAYESTRHVLRRRSASRSRRRCSRGRMRSSNDRIVQGETP
jgi:hypothetical protein